MIMTPLDKMPMGSSDMDGSAMTRWIKIIFGAIFLFWFTLLMWAAFGVCADPPPQSNRLTIELHKSGGYMDYFGSDNIPDNYAQSVMNVDWTINGSLRKRKGVFPFDTLTSPPGGYSSPSFIATFVSTTSNIYLITVVGGGVWYTKIDTSGRKLASSVALSGVSWTRRVDGINNQGYFYITGDDNSSGWRIGESSPGTLYVLQSSQIPLGHFVTNHIDRMLVAGSTTTPLRIFYSSGTAYDSFPASQYFDLTGTREYESITGLGETLLGLKPVYTNTTVRVISGTAYPSAALGTAGNIVVRVVADSIGCVDGATVKNLNNKQYFFSAGSNGTAPGIYVFNGVGVNEVSKAARRFFRDYTQVSSTHIPTAYVDQDKYCLSFASPTMSINSQVVCVEDGTNRISFLKSRPRLGTTPSFYVGFDRLTTYGGNVYAVQAGEGASTNINQIWRIGYGEGDDFSDSPANWNYKTKDFDMGEKGKEKIADRAYLSYAWAPTTFSFAANYDFGNSTKSWNINSTTSYKTPDMETIKMTSSTVVTKVSFGSKRFTHINFELSGGSVTTVDQIDFYSQADTLR